MATIDAIEELTREHSLQRRMLSILERIGLAVEGGMPFPAADVAEVMTFFREFVEIVHHSKEDDGLFPLALEVLDDQQIELIGQLIGDHQDTKELMYSLTLFWEPGDLTEAEREVFSETVVAYVHRFRRHIDLEEMELFPRLATVDPALVLAAMAPYVNVGLGRRDFGDWSAVACRLEERYVAR